MPLWVEISHLRSYIGTKFFEIGYFCSPKYVWTFEFLNSCLRTFYNFSHVWIQQPVSSLSSNLFLSDSFLFILNTREDKKVILMFKYSYIWQRWVPWFLNSVWANFTSCRNSSKQIAKFYCFCWRLRNFSLKRYGTGMDNIYSLQDIKRINVRKLENIL